MVGKRWYIFPIVRLDVGGEKQFQVPFRFLRRQGPLEDADWQISAGASGWPYLTQDLTQCDTSKLQHSHNLHHSHHLRHPH